MHKLYAQFVVVYASEVKELPRSAGLSQSQSRILRYLSATEKAINAYIPIRITNSTTNANSKSSENRTKWLSTGVANFASRKGR